MDVGDVVSGENEHGEGSEIGELIGGDLGDLVVLEVESEEILHVFNGLRWEVSEAVVVESEGLDRGTNVLEGGGVDGADLEGAWLWYNHQMMSRIVWEGNGTWLQERLMSMIEETLKKAVSSRS